MVRARTESTLSVVSEASTVSVPSARERSLSNLFGGGAEEEDVDQAPLKPLKAPAADTATWDARDGGEGPVHCPDARGPEACNFGGHARSLSELPQLG